MKKVFGWLLLIIGVLIIGWGVWASYDIFTAKKPPYEIFKTQQGIEVSFPQEKISGTLQQQAQQQAQQAIREQLERMLSSDLLPKLFNLISWSIFVGILIFAGGRIASLGIQLLKS